MARLPLEGITVIDAGEVLAGPYAPSLMGDMGALVIRVESIQRFGVGRGPGLRALPGTPGFPGKDPGKRPWDRNALYNMYTRNKYGITLDLTRPKGVELYKRLIKLADIVVENWSAGVMERFGLGYEALKEVKQDIIMISAPGFGVEGPYKGYGTYGSNVDAIVGHTSLRGYPGEDPTVTSTHVYPDSVAAFNICLAALVALHYKMRTGNGQYIDVSQAECFAPHLGEFFLDFVMNGRVARPMGNRHPSMGPHGCYRCREEDDWVVIAVEDDAEFAALCRVMGRPELAEDERFADQLSRLRHREELDAVIQEWTLQRTDYEVTHLLQEAGVAAGPVCGGAKLYNDPHVEERGFFESVDHREAGRHRYPGVVWKLSKTPGSIRIPANCLGEHNEYVLKTFLGLSDEEIAQLAEDQIIGDTYLPTADTDKSAVKRPS